MATVSIQIAQCFTKSAGDGKSIPVAFSVPAFTANITSSASSQAGGITVPGAPMLNDRGEHLKTTAYVWIITASGGNVWVKFETDGTPTPVAAAGADWLIVDGQTREFGAFAGQTCAVIDA